VFIKVNGRTGRKQAVKRIVITQVRRNPPDLDRMVAGLLELARVLAEKSETPKSEPAEDEAKTPGDEE
jgi:hypothetical protein